MYETKENGGSALALNYQQKIAVPKRQLCTNCVNDISVPQIFFY